MKNIFYLLLSLVIFSCEKEPKTEQATLRLEHYVGNELLLFDTLLYTSPTNHPYKITRLEYYISEITYIATDGTEQIDDGGYLINPKTESFIKIPTNLQPGSYDKVRFQFGISKTNNVTSYLDQTQENINMAWPSTLGPGDYHYMKFEGKYDSLNLGIEKSFIYHAGPTMGNDNSFTVELPVTEFTIADNSINIIVKTNVQEWLQNPTAYNFPDYKMVMMNQSIQEIYKANGQSVFSFKQLTENVE